MIWARDCVNWLDVIFRVSIIQKRPSGIPDGNMISD